VMKEEEWWFESEEGHLLKWYVSPLCRRARPHFLDRTPT
jgi:hypothetical protein